MTMRIEAIGPGRGGFLCAAATTLLTLTACLDHPIKPVEYETESEIDQSIALSVNKNVDILFVIDNSGSMGEEQATLAANFSAFIDVLERDDVRADYRIGITTTDNGNPACSGTTPEGGRLVATSCRSRAHDFVFNGATVIDATQEACLDICPEEWADIDMLPTAARPEGPMAPRPWIEHIGGRTNLPEGLSTVQAFGCIGPQGINGCGFEEPLEASYRALIRAGVEDEASAGFLRDDAILAVVYVTDEADCSFNRDHADVFLPSGDRALWSDPDAPNATSAVCWNAGVTCRTEADGTRQCSSTHVGPDGAPVDDANAERDAVLRPLSRYIDLLQTIEDDKRRIDLTQDVLVAVIAGVGDDGRAHFADALDPTFQHDFGIGPGCESDSGRAVPPVRLAELAAHFAVDGRQNMFSICNSDYSEALEAIAEAIADKVQPACMPECVADSDPTTPQLDPLCTLTQQTRRSDGTREETPIPPCGPGRTLPGADVHVCYVPLSDGVLGSDGERVHLTEATDDDLSEDCAKHGWNLEFDLVRDGPEPSGVEVRATCVLSDALSRDCPSLG
jgi:hypothetical protein